MLLKNDRKPALAYAGHAENKSDSAKKRDAVTLMSAQEDDFANYSSNKSSGAKKRPAPSQQQRKKSAPSQKSKRRFLPFVFAIIAVVAIIIIIAIVIAIINAPGSNMKKSDTVYLKYQDADGKYHIIIDDEIQEDYVFENEIELTPAENNNFAYIIETSSDGKNMHILYKNGDLVSATQSATDIITKATLSPGIVYTIEANSTQNVYCFTGENSDMLVDKNPSASNFVIAPDASALYYTITTDEGVSQLRKYADSATTPLSSYNGFIPKTLSPNGDYLYGTKDAVLYCIDTTDTDDKGLHPTHKIASGVSDSLAITAINADGDQIIYESNGSSYFYELEEKASLLGEGRFKSVHPDPVVIYEDSLLNSYFEVTAAYVTEDDSEDSDDDNSDGSTMGYTCFLNSKKEVKKLADFLGQFSPDGKYFYYVKDPGENSLLIKVSLSSKDFDSSKHETVSQSVGVVNFFITQKGDLYMVCNEGLGEEGLVTVNFCEDSSSVAQTIKRNVDADSVYLAVNTLYFSVTTTDDAGATATKVYSSTNGSNPAAADFEDINPTVAPQIIMGAHENGYAYIIGDTEIQIFYTSNGKSFEFITSANVNSFAE